MARIAMVSDLMVDYNDIKITASKLNIKYVITHNIEQCHSSLFDRL